MRLSISTADRAPAARRCIHMPMTPSWPLLGLKGFGDSEAVERHRKASKGIASDRKRSKAIDRHRHSDRKRSRDIGVTIERHRRSDRKRSKDIRAAIESDRKASTGIRIAIESDRETSGIKKAPQNRPRVVPLLQHGPPMSFDRCSEGFRCLSVACSEGFRCLSIAIVMSPDRYRDGYRDGCRFWPPPDTKRNLKTHPVVGGRRSVPGREPGHIPLQVASHRQISRLYANVAVSDIRLLTTASPFVSNRNLWELLTNRSLRCQST